ncbi:MAG: phosphate acyltransferase PlsX [Bacteroidales bacterium]|nr:phosphate acyltransferase PlsX [Bacteroidales bacterium]MCF8386237.1 phosphate acyltransferase PlsX [Bacteroidales bacterium]MCF8397490.1 phosphate acyltransferase PlsX [Bacteroidales bacterium]
MKLGLDVMGGDFAPDACIQGAILAKESLPESDTIVLIGKEEIIHEQLKEKNASPEDFQIVHAEEVITMGEHPLKAFTRKTNSSISKGFKLLKNHQIDAFSSAGNSGAMLVGSMYTVNSIQGIIRPCTSAILPKENGGITILLDIGTNPDPKPDVLYQFAILGSIYAQEVYNIENPKIGLLNIGEEEEKGNLLMQHAYQIMKDSRKFNFIGNIEGRDLYNDKADVIVSDGFTGNVVLKQIESMYRMMVKRQLADEYIKRFNYEKYGGSPILGINASVVLGHGISSPLAIKNMLYLSKEIHEAKLSDKIRLALNRYTND